MSLKDVPFKRAYDSDQDNILNDFYIPALCYSKVYLRLAGFFSSTALAVAARGIAGFIRNGGKMKLIVGARLHKSDVEAIRKGIKSREQAITDLMINNLESIESEFVEDHVRALGWMVAHKMLDIKVAIPVVSENVEGGIYHQKVGILCDGEDAKNCISFSGSVNESKMGWLNSIEEFKVFRSWVSSEKAYLKTDVEKFQRYWSGNAKRAIVIDFPAAVRGKLIQMAPETIDELHLDKHYQRLRKKPWQHQVEAIQAWVNNDFRGVFSMATGSGKTLAALYASTLAPRSTITIVIVPTIAILHQWAQRDIPKFDKSARVIICSGGAPEWRKLLLLELAEARRLGKNYCPDSRLYVIAVIDTAATSGFIRLFDGIPPENLQVICDEVHHMGAPTYQNCMRLPCKRRLGLSATPERDWDPVGTNKIMEYFGQIVYEYGIKSATRDGHLCHYRYHPFFAFLDQEEFERFFVLTRKINMEMKKLEAQARNKRDEEERRERLILGTTQKLQMLLLKRARIKKKAKDKVRVFREVLASTPTRPLIVFCEDHEQVEKIKEVLKEEVSNFAIYTSRMTSSQRKRALNGLRNGEVDVLLAIRCLDEGLDVPDCEGCILVASSSSTRQFVQRRGRVLRRASPDKVAIIDDIIVLPADVRNMEQKSVAKTLIQQELNRVSRLIEASDNEWEVRNTIRKQLSDYGLQEAANL